VPVRVPGDPQARAREGRWRRTLGISAMLCDVFPGTQHYAGQHHPDVTCWFMLLRRCCPDDPQQCHPTTVLRLAGFLMNGLSA